jgi:hypothetical protein
MLQNLYPQLAGFHGLFRWIVLALGVFAIFVAFSGWKTTTPPGKHFLRLGILFALAMDVELISGLLLYAAAQPLARSVFIAHGVIMFFAVLLAHVGGALTRKASSDELKYRAPAIVWTLSLLLMLGGIPRGS